MSISVTNLSKNYGNQKAVNQITFKINKGEVVGFLGPNGAGKSTVMKMITGYLPSDAGEINVCGIRVTDNNLEIKKKIGYLPEANPLYPEMYIKEYLNFLCSVHQISDPKTKIAQIIETVGLLLESHKKIGQLSKGYKQRVGLAAALVHNPEVLILDEPTSGLDPNQIVEIRNVIKSLAVNKTILFSSHIMQEVEAICDRVIIINKGNIVADDSLSNLQKISGANDYVSIQIKESMDIELLKGLDNIIEIKKINPTTFKIHCSSAEKLRKQLLQLSVEQNLNIILLQTEKQNLESVFKALTT